MNNPTSKIRSEVLVITPQMAADWLLSKAPNRNVKEKVVERYSRALEEHKWKLNGESIIISDVGRLLDGQNRLEACVRTGIAFTSVVVFGIYEDTFDTMNSGAKRNNADVLVIEGEKNSHTLAAAIKFLFFFDQGLSYDNSDRYPTGTEILKTLEKHPQIRLSTTFCLQVRDITASSTVAFIHCLACEHGLESKADMFVEQLTSGENLYKGNPALTLREKFLTDKRLQNHELKFKVKLAFLIKAFNAYMKGRTLKNLFWRDSEEFPTLEF